MIDQVINSGVDVVDDQRVVQLVPFGLPGALHHLIGNPVEQVGSNGGVASNSQLIGHVLDELVHAAGVLGHHHGRKWAFTVGHTGIYVHIRPIHIHLFPK